MPEVLYYLSINKKQFGPFTKGQVINLFNSEKISYKTFIWKQGISSWVRLGDLDEFSNRRKIEKPEIPIDFTEEDSDRKWLLYDKGEIIGPLIYEEVLDLIDNKKIRRNTFAYKEGMRDWQELFFIKEFSGYLSKEAPKAINKIYDDSITLSVGIFDDFLHKLKSFLNPERLRSQIQFFTDLGSMGYILTAILYVICSIYWSIKLTNFTVFLITPIGVLIIFFLQYMYAKFLESIENLLLASPTKIKTNTWLDWISLISFFSSVFVLLGSIIFVISGGNTAVFGVMMDRSVLIVSAISVSFYLFIISWISLNPNILNVRISRTTSIGEEALGLLSYTIKMILKLLPIPLGLSILYGTTSLIYFGFVSTSNDLLEYYKVLTASGTNDFLILVMMFLEIIKMEREILAFIYAAFTPVIGYLTFMFYYLAIDVLRAFLGIPDKIDALKAVLGNKGE